MFANSSVSEKLNNATLPVTYISLLPCYEAIPYYIIAYPLTQFCMKEHQSCTSNGQVLFNNMLRSARNQIECAFGRLKAWWGFLSRKVDPKFESIPTVVYSCFVLHNYCEQNKDSGFNFKLNDIWKRKTNFLMCPIKYTPTTILKENLFAQFLQNTSHIIYQMIIFRT